MRAWPPSIFLWTSEYLFSRIPGEAFLVQTYAVLALELPVASSAFVIASILPLSPDSWRGLRCKMRAYSLLLPCWGMLHSTQGYPNLLPSKQHPGIFICEPAYCRCPVLFLLNFVRLVISSTTHHRMCSSAFSWTRFHLRCGISSHRRLRKKPVWVDTANWSC